MPQNKYLIAKRLLLAGDVKNLSDLLDVAQKTPLARDAKTTPERFNRLLGNLALLRFGDIHNIAQVIGVDEKIILEIFYNEFIKKRRKEKK